MPALVAGIHVLLSKGSRKDVDGRDKPGHDVEEQSTRTESALALAQKIAGYQAARDETRDLASNIRVFTAPTGMPIMSIVGLAHYPGHRDSPGAGVPTYARLPAQA